MLIWMLGHLDLSMGLVPWGSLPWAAIDPQALLHLSREGLILAQSTDADLIAQAQKAWKVFIESGQVWALLIGLFIGYTFRGFTTYGS
jgi:hypothetical protein